MISITDKDVRKIAKDLVLQGWTVEWTGKNHVRFRAPHGGVVFFSGTTGDRNAYHQLRMKLRKQGAKV